jgi:hypothetical protein
MVGQSLQAISIEGVVLLLVNLVVAAGVLITAGSLRRLIRQNDEQHRQNDEQHRAIDAQITAEREARHAEARQTDNRTWALAADLKENYQRRAEGMRLYGTLVHKINETHRETLEEIRRLPCTQARCPEGESR